MSALRLFVFATACAAALCGDAQAKAVRVHAARSVQSDGVLVPMDNVALVTFKKPVSTVYIGNPSIAEVTMVDSQHAFVLGKRFGVTNLIGLLADKKVAVNESVLVSARVGSAVTIFRGASTFNYACSSFHCETRPVPGDPKIYFDNTEQAAMEHEDTGNKATNTSPQH
jgi:hypothetical protein